MKPNPPATLRISCSPNLNKLDADAEIGTKVVTKREAETEIGKATETATEFGQKCDNFMPISVLRKTPCQVLE